MNKLPENSVAVLAVIYHEPDWLETLRCMAGLDGVPVYLTDRNGAGGLAVAFNRGFNQHDLVRYRYVWFLTNITFNPDILPLLVEGLEKHKTTAVAIQPAYESDHRFLRPGDGNPVAEVPFVEFTCPLVRAPYYYREFLDPDLPYTGHDVDWGYRARKLGFSLLVHRKLIVGHTYIRHSKSTHPSTLVRSRLRHAAEAGTQERLRKKWGVNWRGVLGYQGGI